MKEKTGDVVYRIVRLLQNSNLEELYYLEKYITEFMQKQIEQKHITEQKYIEYKPNEETKS